MLSNFSGFWSCGRVLLRLAKQMPFGAGLFSLRLPRTVLVPRTTGERFVLVGRVAEGERVVLAGREAKVYRADNPRDFLPGRTSVPLAVTAGTFSLFWFFMMTLK